ncbi:MAG: tape measure protein [Campylobacter sp.]|nr:tape measure protein [Campylobacter sp.]
MKNDLTIKISVDAKTGAINVVNSQIKNLKANVDQSSKSLSSMQGSINQFNFSKLSYLGNYIFPKLTEGVLVLSSNFLSLADTYKTLEARLNLVSLGNSELNSSFNALFASSQTASTSLSETTNLYISLRSATESLAVSQRDVLNVTDTINKTLTISGASAQASAAALMQLGQAFASGVLRGEELNSVLEQAPRLARAIADGMGVSAGALREMGAAGEITSETLMNALLSQSETINAEFETIPTTIENARTRISNSILALVGDLDKTSGASSGVANSLSLISRWIDTNRGNIVEFGSDVYKSFQLIGSALILVVNGVREGTLSATLAVSNGINSFVKYFSDKINTMLEKLESVMNAVSEFAGLGEISLGRIDGDLIDTTSLKAEYEKVKNENNEIFESIKAQIQDIAKVSYEANSDAVSDVKNTVNAVNKEASKLKPLKSAVKIDPKKEYLDRLNKEIEYYKAIGDLSNQRLKEKEKEILRLKELGLNNLQIQEYFAKEQTKFEKEERLKRLQDEERYYELLGEKAKAANIRARINAENMQGSGNYSNEEIANANFGKVQQKANYDTLNSAMGYNDTIVGQFQNRLNAVDDYYNAEMARIEAYYEQIGNVEGAAEAKRTEILRTQMQARMSEAGAGFDALGGLAKMFYDASGGENKKAMRAYQAMMVGKAIVNTYTAATNAYASAGNPILGAALAAVAIAQGMAQVAQIKAQKFHTGGMVGGGGLRSDEVNAVLLKGEYVLNREQTKQLKDSATTTPQNSESGGITIVNTVDPHLFETWAESRSGRKIIKNIVGA